MEEDWGGHHGRPQTRMIHVPRGGASAVLSSALPG